MEWTFESEEIAQRVSDHLREVTIQGATLKHKDERAVITAMALEGAMAIGSKCKLPFKDDRECRSSPRIWVGCLEAYNNGQIHGMWIDAMQLEEIEDDISWMLSWSPTLSEEEWEEAEWNYKNIIKEYFIGDSEGFKNIPVNSLNIEEISLVARGIENHKEAFVEFWNIYNSTKIEKFEEMFRGKYNSLEDFAYEVWEASGKIEAMKAVGIEHWHIDWEAVIKELGNDHYYQKSGDSYYVFEI